VQADGTNGQEVHDLHRQFFSKAVYEAIVEQGACIEA